MTTMFSLMGQRPASRAAVIPSMTRSNASLRAMSLKVSIRKVSSEMLMRLSPASRSASAFCRSRTPLVVIVMSSVGSIALIIPMSSSSLTRTSGSPPVILIVRTPYRSTKMRARRTISSYLRMSSRASHLRPSAGMQ